jgi:hypothetical protein
MVPVKINGEVRQLDRRRASIDDGLGLARSERRVMRVGAMAIPARSRLLVRLVAALVFSFNANNSFYVRSPAK